MVAKVYNIPDHTRRDTFEGFDVTVKINTVALDLTGALIRMQMRIDSSATPIKEFNSDVDGGITITDAAAGKFTFDEQIIDVPAQQYFYDIQIELADDKVYTFLRGNWTIIQDYTYDN